MDTYVQETSQEGIAISEIEYSLWGFFPSIYS
jgi:hypothetical protein